MMTTTIAALLIGGLSYAEVPESVTFTHSCAHSSVVLAALGEELGMQIKPSGSVKQDYFLVRFDDVPVKDALDKIAETLNATWTVKSGVRYLGRTRAQEIADFEIEIDARKAAIEKAVARMEFPDLTSALARSLAIQSRDFGPLATAADRERHRSISRQLPGYRAMVRLIKLLDLDKVVKALGYPLIFSVMGDGEPMPPGADAVFRQMRQEWEVTAREAGEVGIASGDRTIGVYLKFASDSPILTERLQLSVHASDTKASFYLSFIADNKWETIGYYSLSYSDETTIPRWVLQLDAPAKMEDVVFASVAPSTLGQESRVLKEALLSSEGADVVLSAPGAVLLQAAEEMHVSLVAHLPDSAFLALAKGKIAQGSSLAQLLSVMIADQAVTVELGDGWLMARPKAPYTARRKRMDRRAFRAMFGHAVDRGSIPIEVFSDFAATTLEDDPAFVANHLLGRALKLRLGLPTYGIENFRIYGLLTPEERRLAKTEGVTLTGRPDASRFVLALGKKTSRYMEEHEWGAMAMRQPFREYEEALALIAVDDKWTISVRDEGFLQLNLFDRDVSSWLTFMDVRSYAMNMVSAERRGGSSAMADYSMMAPVYGATVYLGYERPGGGGTSFGRYADPIGDSVFGSINDLPDEVRSRLLEEIDKARGGGRS
ncbi:MAG: hypothetical protein IH944_10695 [Armatimonadetes bacterium]|nr:hypothetical protein [Armatimonadota bacterium]